MQLTGSQFTTATADAGNDLSTFPDFPAEIRAPAGTTYGVSGFQIHFAAHDVQTPGDAPDVLVAMNPAALKVNTEVLKPGGLLVVNTGAFTPNNLKKAGYEVSPLEDGTVDRFRVLAIDVSKLTLQAVKDVGLGSKEAHRCKNMWTLGLMYWLFGREREQTISWLKGKFAKRPKIAEANIAALNAGHIYGENAELPHGINAYQVPAAKLTPGEYRNISGNEATAWGLVTGAKLAGLQVMYGSYPITPASSLLHNLARLKHFGGRGGCRSELRWLDRCHRHVRSWRRIEVRNDWLGDHGRAAIGRRQRPAWRAFNRASDQNRTVRSLPGGLGAQRRRATRSAGRRNTGRLLLHGHRSDSPCGDLHDAGHLAQ
jgi:2-oxoglutarate ferredoxin oxidoreductase subunit alpha